MPTVEELRRQQANQRRRNVPAPTLSATSTGSAAASGVNGNRTHQPAATGAASPNAGIVGQRMQHTAVLDRSAPIATGASTAPLNQNPGRPGPATQGRTASQRPAQSPSQPQAQRPNQPPQSPNQSPQQQDARYDAVQIELQDSDTVEGRIQGIIARNSPMMQRAETQGLQRAHQRGLLNSSMAIGEAENAVYDHAMPIASQDAATSAQFRALNQGAENTARQFNAGNVHDRQMLAQDIEGRSRLQGEAGVIESRLIQERGEIERQLQHAEGEIRMRLLNRQGSIDRDLQVLRGGQAMSLQRLQGSQSMDLQRLQGSQAMGLQRLQGSQSLSQIAAQGSQNLRLARLDQDTQMSLQRMRGTQAESLARIENANRDRIQASQSASLFYSQTAAAMGDILNNPEIPEAQKQQLIDRQLQLLENGLHVMGGIADMDFGSMLNFRRPTQAVGPNAPGPRSGGGTPRTGGTPVLSPEEIARHLGNIRY